MHPSRVRWVENNRQHGCLTASSFGCALGLKGKIYHYVDYLRNYVGTEDEFRGNLATFHGQRTEDISKMVYERLVHGNKEVDDGGFYICEEHPNQLAASPDGICIWSDQVSNSQEPLYPKQDPQRRIPFRLLEIKSPVASMYDASRDGNTIHGIPMAYMCQMQGQLFISGAEECDFFVYVARWKPEVACWRVYRSQEFWDWMRPKLLQISEWVAAPKGTPTSELLPLDFKYDEIFDWSKIPVEPLISPCNVVDNAPLVDPKRFSWWLDYVQEECERCRQYVEQQQREDQEALMLIHAGDAEAQQQLQQRMRQPPQCVHQVKPTWRPKLPQPENMMDGLVQVLSRGIREGDWVLWQRGALEDEEPEREDAVDRQQPGDDDDAMLPTQLKMTPQAQIVVSQQARSTAATATTTTTSSSTSTAMPGRQQQQQQQKILRSPSVQLTPSRCCCCGYQPTDRPVVPSIMPAQNGQQRQEQTQKPHDTEGDFTSMPRLARVIRFCTVSGRVELEVLKQRSVVAAARALGKTLSQLSQHVDGDDASASQLQASSGGLSKLSTPLFASSGNGSGKQFSSFTQQPPRPVVKRVSYFTPSMSLLRQVMKCSACGANDASNNNNNNNNNNTAAGGPSSVSADIGDPTERVMANPATDSIIFVRRRGKPVRDEESFWKKTNPDAGVNSVKQPAVQQQQQQQPAAPSSSSAQNSVERRQTRPGVTKFTPSLPKSGGGSSGMLPPDNSAAATAAAAVSNPPPAPAAVAAAEHKKRRFYNALSCELILQLWHSPITLLLRTSRCSSRACLAESLTDLHAVIGGDLLRVPPKTATALWHIAAAVCGGDGGPATALAASSGSGDGHLRPYVPRDWVADSFQLGSLCHTSFLRSVQAAGSFKTLALCNSVCAVMTVRAFQNLLRSGAAGRRRASSRLGPPPTPLALRHIFSAPQYEEDPDRYLEALGEGIKIGACSATMTGANNSQHHLLQPQPASLAAAAAPCQQQQPQLGGGSTGSLILDSQQQDSQQGKQQQPSRQLRSGVTRFVPKSQQQQQQQQQQNTPATTAAFQTAAVVQQDSAAASGKKVHRGLAAIGAAEEEKKKKNSQEHQPAPTAAPTSTSSPFFVPTAPPQSERQQQQPQQQAHDVWKCKVWVVVSEEEGTGAIPDIYEVRVAAANRDETAPWVWYVNGS